MFTDRAAQEFPPPFLKAGRENETDPACPRVCIYRLLFHSLQEGKPPESPHDERKLLAPHHPIFPALFAGAFTDASDLKQLSDQSLSAEERISKLAGSAILFYPRFTVRKTWNKLEKQQKRNRPPLATPKNTI